MKLTHWSKDDLGEVYSVTPGFVRDRPSPFGKPKGFWLSDESDEGSWSAWCAAEGFPRGDVRTDFFVTLDDVLHLKDTVGLLWFTDTYGRWEDGIDWPRVGRDFKGILITPYNWDMRLELDWYYGWDCASGCFWDVSCLTKSDVAKAA